MTLVFRDNKNKVRILESDVVYDLSNQSSLKAIIHSSTGIVPSSLILGLIQGNKS